MKKIEIPIEEWIKLIESGVSTPATVIPKGTSMWPTIRGGKDLVEVIPINHKKDISLQLKVGDIIVFRRADGTYIIHRIWKGAGELSDKEETDGPQQYLIQTFGDNCRQPDAPIAPEEICGKVTKIYRGDKVIDLSKHRTILVGQINRKLVPVRSGIASVYHRITGSYKNDNK